MILCTLLNTGMTGQPSDGNPCPGGPVSVFEKETGIENSADHVIIKAPILDREIYVDHGISGSTGTAVWVAVRPVKMVINTAPPSGEFNHAQGKVEEIAYIGGLSVYHVKTQSGMPIRATLANVSGWYG